jgi:phosphopantetheine--protein transferase-like protein
MTPLDTIRDCLKFWAVGTLGTALPESGTPVPITGDQQHIWSARYSDLDRYYPVLSDFISAQEGTKAAGFKKSRDAQNYILRHGMVRAVLGQYILKEPQELRFVHEVSGKPNLDPMGEVHDIRFSLSHTDEMVCLGISKKSSIGLDIVKCDSRYPFSATAQYLFTPEECQWIAQTPSHEQHVRFFRIWSLKEALLKATGGGVGMMQETEVSGIMENRFLNGFYPVSVGKTEMVVFIHESGSCSGHHCTLVIIPATDAGSLN